MKYRTIIELICDASDREDASNIAGDYLRGEVDFGVEMHCRTTSLWAHRTIKYAASCTVMLLVFTSLLIKSTPVNETGKKGDISQLLFKNTSTVMPELKTQDKAEFREKWQEKADEAVKDKIAE